MSGPWRVGDNYKIHVYEGDRPVATFHNEFDAMRAVAAVNKELELTDPDHGDHDDELPLVLTTEQAATVLQITRRTVYNLINAGTLRSIKVGGSRRITREALKEYMEVTS